MKSLRIQYPDGKIHSIAARNFYSVRKNGKDVFVLEYEDYTTNVRNCFSVLEQENGIFVNKPLASSTAYMLFSQSVRFHRKKLYNLDLLPEEICLCSEALLKLGIKPDRSEGVNPPVPIQEARSQLVVFRDISPNYPSFPYFLNAQAAKVLGFSDLDNYYNLTPKQLKDLSKDYDISYIDSYITPMELNLVPNESLLGEGVVPPCAPKESVDDRSSITIYEDTAEEKGKSPYYIDMTVAINVGFAEAKDVSGYYRLTLEELDNLEKNYNVKYEKIVMSHPKKRIMVLQDISPKRDRFPYYLDYFVAKPLGFNVAPSQYYQLTPDELENLKKKYDVVIVPRMLVLNKGNGIGRNNSKPKLNTGKLNEREIAELDRFFEAICDFEDFYQYFGFDNLREASKEQILFSERMRYLDNLFSRGANEGNPIAINLLEFLEEFKRTLEEKEMSKK